jgi:PilZ domain
LFFYIPFWLPALHNDGGTLIVQGRGNTRLRYRFVDLEQARAHVHDVDGRALFFVRDQKICLLPDASVCLSLGFESGEVTRLLHGRAVAVVEGAGTWLQLLDLRPLREISATEAVRRSIRMGCDALVEVRSDRHVACARMLDLSPGGARLSGVEEFSPGDYLELRVLSPDRLTFHDLSYAHAAWVEESEMGVQFDRTDAVGRHAVARLLAETEDLWASAWECVHPGSCCTDDGVLDPAPPRLQRAAAAK